MSQWTALPPFNLPMRFLPADPWQAIAGILIFTGCGVQFGEMMRQSIPQYDWSTVDVTIENARQNPNSTELWVGHDLRLWADVIDRRATDYMSRFDNSFPLIQGGSDAPEAVNVARAVNDLFTEAGRCNLTHWEIPGFDHGMASAEIDTCMTDILPQAYFWLNAHITACSSTNSTSG